MMTKKKKTESEVLSLLQARCSRAEYCTYDVYNYIHKFQLTEDAEKRIVQKLVEQDYINEVRYAHAFVRDKFRFNRWGSNRIRQELLKRKINSNVIDDALSYIDDEKTTETLKQLIETKRRSLRGRNQHEIDAKLMRFALARGFSYEQIRKTGLLLTSDLGEETNPDE